MVRRILCSSSLLVNSAQSFIVFNCYLRLEISVVDNWNETMSAECAGQKAYSSKCRVDMPLWFLTTRHISHC